MQVAVARILTAIVLVAWALPAAAQSRPMTPAQFVEELDRLTDAVSSGAPGQVPVIDLPSAWSVEYGAQRVETPALWLRAALAEGSRNPSRWPAQRATILARLDALRGEAEELAASSSFERTDDAAAREALTEVLAGPEFERMAQEGAVARLSQRVLDWLTRMWQRFGGGRLGGRGTAVLFAWIAVLIALAALVAWLLRFARQANRGRGDVLGPSLPAPRRPARLWAAEALHAADPREAIRCAYRAVLSGLEEEGAWRPDDTRTPREYLRILPPDHRRRTLVADVTGRFEEIWYGARAATSDDRAAVLARLQEMGCLPAD